MSNIKWVHKGEGGYWESTDGRFSITPLFYGRVNAVEYKCRDRVGGAFDSLPTVRACKKWAASRAKDTQP